MAQRIAVSEPRLIVHVVSARRDQMTITFRSILVKLLFHLRRGQSTPGRCVIRILLGNRLVLFYSFRARPSSFKRVAQSHVRFPVRWIKLHSLAQDIYSMIELARFEQGFGFRQLFARKLLLIARRSWLRRLCRIRFAR